MKLAKDCAMLRKNDCEGYCAHPMGAVKSNSSRVRYEGRQVVQLSQVLRAFGKHST
jgi:hypothetical protein